jgi:hypothetical protein
MQGGGEFVGEGRQGRAVFGVLTFTEDRLTSAS